jgi:four helix bundle protein
MPIKSFRDLDVWRLGMDLVDVVYDVSESFPRHELFGLRSQVRRAAVAIPSHVAEGSRQRTMPARIHYVTLANCSDAELDTQLEIAIRRRFAPERELRHAQELTNQVSKMLYGLSASLERRREQ